MPPARHAVPACLDVGSMVQSVTCSVLLAVALPCPAWIGGGQHGN